MVLITISKEPGQSQVKRSTGQVSAVSQSRTACLNTVRQQRSGRSKAVQ